MDAVAAATAESVRTIGGRAGKKEARNIAKTAQAKYCASTLMDLLIRDAR
jgi:hypothetical protein